MEIISNSRFTLLALTHGDILSWFNASKQNHLFDVSDPLATGDFLMLMMNVEYFPWSLFMYS